MPRIGIHKLIESHTISCFSRRISFRETTDTFFEILARLDKEQAYNSKYFTHKYCKELITEQYNKCREHKHFRGDSVREAIFALFKYNYKKYDKNWAFLPQAKIAKDLGVCTKTIQRALNQMKKEGLITLSKKWSSFRHLAAEYSLTARGLVIGKIIEKVTQKAISVYEKYSESIINKIVELMKSGLGRDSYLLKESPIAQRTYYNRVLDDLIRTGELDKLMERA